MMFELLCKLTCKGPIKLNQLYLFTFISSETLVFCNELNWISSAIISEHDCLYVHDVCEMFCLNCRMQN